MRRKGFTLAEVLVTLAIIGVVAALTVPSLIQSTNNSQTISSLQKANSTLNQALHLAVMDNLTTPANASNSDVYDLFSPYLSAVELDAAGDNITTTDGIRYSFRGGNPCNTGLATSICYVIADINGTSAPNATASAANPNNDQFLFVVLGNRAVPASANTTAFAATGTYVDDYAAQLILGN